MRVPIVLDADAVAASRSSAVGSGGSGIDAALRTAIVHLCVWSGGTASFSAGVSSVAVDPMRIGRDTAMPWSADRSDVRACAWTWLGCAG